MSIYAPAITYIWQAIESYGLDPEPLFAEEGILFELPIDPQRRIPKESVDRVRARVVKQLGAESFGIRAARFVHPSNFGALGYAWMASSTLRSALQRLSNYIRVFNADAEVVLKDRGTALVVTDYIYSDSENYAARDDTSMAALIQLCRFICGPGFSPERVAIRHAAPVDTTEWDQFFGCPVSFGEPENRFWIDRKIADKMLPNANTQLVLMNEQLLARDLARLESQDVVARVRAVITAQLTSGTISETTVADAIQMTVRTMHRQLSSQGKNFSTLLMEVRRELAERYLRGTNLPLTEIAFLIGFTQASSFSRAFRKWTDKSPSEYRREHAA